MSEQGWRLVPVEPTPAMKEAAHDASRQLGPVEPDAPELGNALPVGYELWSAGFVYRAMLAAAPQPQPAQASAQVLEALRLSREYVENATNRFYDGTGGEGIRNEARRRLALIDAAIAASEATQAAREGLDRG
jgi:hypothetical protein